MAIIFKTAIDDTVAFEKVERIFAQPSDYDGYLNVFGDKDEQTVSWSRGTSAEEFKAEITEALRLTWETAPHWLIYERRDDRDDAGTNEIRKTAIGLTRTYGGVIVVTLSLLGRRDNSNDLELLFLCFQEDAQRRNFKVRYEGKFIPE